MKIGFLFQMHEEAQPIISAMEYAFPIKKGEVISLKNGDSCIISGIGRANAASAVIKLLKAGCQAIVNIGTCGSTYSKQIASILVPDIFYDGDFTFESQNYKKYDGANINSKEESSDSIRIFTVSHFSTEPLDDKPYLVDMESYAVIAACRAQELPVLPVKIISDNADTDAESTFEENVTRVIQKNINKILAMVEDFRSSIA